MCSIGVPFIFRFGEFAILFVFLNIMNFDLVSFNDSRFNFSHSDISINSLFIVSTISLFSLVVLLKSLQGLKSVVSSAYILNWKILLASGRSFI